MAEAKVAIGSDVVSVYEQLAKQVTDPKGLVRIEYKGGFLVTVNRKSFLVSLHKRFFGPPSGDLKVPKFCRLDYTAERWTGNIMSELDPYDDVECHDIAGFFNRLNKYAVCAQNEDTQGIKAYLQIGIPVDFSVPLMRSPFEMALTHKPKKAEALVAGMIKANLTPTPRHLHHAIKRNQTGVIDQLIVAGVLLDEPYQNQLPLLFTIKQAEKVGVDRFQIEQTALHLIDRGASTNFIIRNEKNTLLHLAITYRMFELAAKALETYPDHVNAQNNVGDTPLHLALSDSKVNLAFVQQLLAQSADVNLPNLKGELPIVIAAKKGRADIVEALLNANAKVFVNDQTAKGKSVKVYQTLQSMFPKRNYKGLNTLIEKRHQEELKQDLHEFQEIDDFDDLDSGFKLPSRKEAEALIKQVNGKKSSTSKPTATSQPAQPSQQPKASQQAKQAQQTRAAQPVPVKSTQLTPSQMQQTNDEMYEL
ncbi:ankyrin repeat domain-containing protein [Parashewanella tropica]|uniref:ankyrin repeat domain-containing protein n=1 Tax=Parashewanella tropica TaxID=2547970 RepID=UPI0010595E70|nr:ankyrin repeat domain-containing protein [Parashewanella tropica]